MQEKIFKNKYKIYIFFNFSKYLIALNLAHPVILFITLDYIFLGLLYSSFSLKLAVFHGATTGHITVKEAERQIMAEGGELPGDSSTEHAAEVLGGGIMWRVCN